MKGSRMPQPAVTARLVAMPALTALPAALLAAVLLLAAGPLAAAPGDQPVVPLPKPLVDNKDRTRTVSLPARGLFKGDQLTDSAKSQLTDLILNALGLQVEVALLVPVGPWQIDGSGQGERDLTPARLQALRKYLTDRGIDPQRIFVESRIDPKLTEPRLDVQLVGRPAND
jgi:OmpA-OmpF porin, OOP family